MDLDWGYESGEDRNPHPKKKVEAKPKQPWFVYLLRCKDSSLYCGITIDVDKRVATHNAGKGAKYLVPSRLPVTPVHVERFESKGDALRREIAIKKLSKQAKESLVASK